jgi:RNA polymerase sigma-70 factor (ECF subfamily)
MQDGIASITAMKLFSGQATKPAPSHVAAEVVELFEQFRSPLLRYLITLGQSVQDSEEIIQEVFLALFQHLSRGKRRDNLRGWIFRVAHNFALKQLSSSKARFQRTSLPLDEIENEITSSAPNPEQALQQKRTAARIHAIIAALPEQDRRCLHLRAEGLRYREIAEVLGISLGSVANALERAISRLNRAREQAGNR